MGHIQSPSSPPLQSVGVRVGEQQLQQLFFPWAAAGRMRMALRSRDALETNRAPDRAGDPCDAQRASCRGTSAKQENPAGN